MNNVEEKAEKKLPLSRTKKKQQAKQIEMVAEQLVDLTDNQFSQLKLPSAVAREAESARSTKGRSSQRRQLKHLAGMLRKSEESLESLLQQLQDLDQIGRKDKREFQQLEKLRDRLCQPENFESAFNEMLTLVLEIDRKAIARLARSVHQHEDKRAYREIFKRLREGMKESE